MPETNADDLHHETFERWRSFYRKGLISRRTFMQALAVWSGAAAAGAAGLAGGGTAQAAATPPGPEPGTPLARRQGKDSLTVVFLTDMPNLDPHMHLLREGIILYYHLFDNLGVRDMSTMRIGPHLATSWEPTTPTTWEMRLRRDVRFHNGDPFTADTVKFNFDRVLDPANKSPQRSNHTAITAVEKIDDYAVRFLTKDPYPIFTERLQNFQFISEKVAREKGDAWLAENPVGTGPYKFVEWKRGQSITLERNDDYWGDSKGTFRTITIRVIPDPATGLAELLSGNVDIVRVVPFDQMSTVNNSGRARTAVQRILRVSFIGLDCKGRTSANPFQDKRVRHAANHAINVPLYIERLQPGGDRAPAALNPMHFGFDPSIQPHEYDPDKARDLLREAGYADGFEARWIQGPSSMPNQQQVDQAIQRDLQRVGIRTTFQRYDDTNVHVSQVTEGKAGPMWNWNWGSYSVFDADGLYWDMFHPSTIYNYWENEAFAKLIEEGRTTIDESTRLRVYSEAQKIVREEAPVIFQWGFHSIWGVNNSVDWQPSPDEIDRYFNAKPK